jgi:hypothetical protein
VVKRRIQISELEEMRLKAYENASIYKERIKRCYDKSVGDSPRDPLKQRGNPHLKPATKPKHNLPNPAENGPRRRDPDGPSRRPS